MKRLVLAFILLVAPTVPALAFQPSLGSGEKTADTAIHNGKCYITNIEIITDGTNDAKVILYDNGTGASGTVIREITVAGGDNYGGWNWIFPRQCNSGIYGDVTGTGASFIVEYITRPVNE
jgi:hypothetical protein